MNESAREINGELIEYQTDRIQNLIAEMVECCEDRKLYESRKFGLPYSELKSLMLFNGERYLTAKVMAQKLDLAKSRITKLTKGLLTKGLIDQIDDPADARIKLLRLSPKGSELAERIQSFQKDIHRQVLLQMDEAERKHVLSYMESLRSAMEAVKEMLV